MPEMLRSAPRLRLLIQQRQRPPSSAEQSSKPGVEARIALLGNGNDDDRDQIGVGGILPPTSALLERSFDSWAGTFDVRVSPLFALLQFSGNLLSGTRTLGPREGEATRILVYRPNPATGGHFSTRLDDVGGWAQLKEKVRNQRLEFKRRLRDATTCSSAEMRRYVVSGGTYVPEPDHFNRTFTGNVIYSMRQAHIFFSLEYRRLESSPGIRWHPGSKQYHWSEKRRI